MRMFTSRRTWPHMILPVKNRKFKDKDVKSFPMLGILAKPADEELPLVIYETDMYAPDFNNSMRHIYQTVQEAVDAGWVVD